MEKCLVLGGTGFIGNHLCNRLVLEGKNLKIIRKRDSKEPEDNKNVAYITHDFRNIKDFEYLLDGVDTVFHLISTTIPSNNTSTIDKEIEYNVVQTIRLLESMIKSKTKKIIFISSGGTVYGIPKYLPIDEEHPTNPISSYGIYKLTIEKYLMLYSHLYGLEYKIVRVSNPYGPGQDINKIQGVIPIYLRKILNGNEIEIWGNGNVIRDYIYINDTIEGILSVANSTVQEKVFNIGSGKGKTLLEVIAAIEKTLDIGNIKIKHLKNRNIDVPANILDISRASKMLGWYPKYTLELGIREMIKDNKKLFKKIARGQP